jgi:hypothetical protein
MPGTSESLSVALPHHLQLHEASLREIRITRAIGEVKKAILKGSTRAEPSATRRRVRSHVRRPPAVRGLYHAWNSQSCDLGAGYEPQGTQSLRDVLCPVTTEAGDR